jgi:hypothetical protein
MKTLASTDVHGVAWRDCDEGGLHHRWTVDIIMEDGVTYWRCTRCPVRTRNAGDRPPQNLRPGGR